MSKKKRKDAIETKVKVFKLQVITSSPKQNPRERK